MYLLAELAKEDVGSTVYHTYVGSQSNTTSIFYTDSTRPRAKALGVGIHSWMKETLKEVSFLFLQKNKFDLAIGKRYNCSILVDYSQYYIN